MNSKSYILAIDGGSQSTKVSIFDTVGNRLLSNKVPLRALNRTNEGMAEHPGDDLWDSLISSCQQLMQEFDEDPNAIVAIGLCSIRCCRALLKSDGQLASPVINWMDQRLAKPYVHENVDVAYVTTASGYLSHRLTNTFTDTAANYEGQWPIDKETWAWSEQQANFETFGVSREKLFDLVLPGDVLGKVSADAARATGLPEGIPVVATANDKAVEALGVGLHRADQMSGFISLGTYIGGMIVGESSNNGSHYFANMAAEPPRFLYECGGIRNGMGNISWLKNLLSADSMSGEKLTEQQLNQEASHVPVGSNGLLTLPDWLAPADKTYKRGAMIGFSNRTSRADMYRSMLEGISLSMLNHFNAMLGELNQSLSNLIVAGGGAQSDLFMQILADVFNLPTTRNQITDAVGVGAAMTAAVAVGIHPSFEEASEKMVHSGQTFKPCSSSHRLYSKLNHQVLQNFAELVEPTLQALHNINLTVGSPTTTRLENP